MRVLAPLLVAATVTAVAIGGVGTRERAAGATLEVAQYRFRAPAAFRSTPRRCPTLPEARFTARLTSPVVSAARRRGACLSIVTVAPPPMTGRHLRVGHFDARMVTTREGLLLVLLAPDHRRGIVFAAAGMSDRDLVATARSGLRGLKTLR